MDEIMNQIWLGFYVYMATYVCFTVCGSVILWLSYPGKRRS